MPLSKERVSYLLQAWTSRKATEEEEKELFDWVSTTDDEDSIKEHIQQLIKQFTGREPMPAVDWENLYEQVLKKRQSEELHFKVRKMTPLLRRVAAVASIVLAIGAGSYFLFFNHTKQSETAKTYQPVLHDVAPPNVATATLKLRDGRIVYLDSAKNGSLALQDNINVVKLADGQISYQATGNGSESVKVSYNTITNPRGSKVVSLTLVDGTQVWLNSESSLTYPTTMSGNERKVEITGEAYFEVTHDAIKPFIVKDVEKNIDVQVLGTQFNVNTYYQEAKVTLLKGSVKITKNNVSELLKPGQQARVNSTITVVSDADLEQVMAWKNGLFDFKKADIETIMKEIARWYDLEVVYEGKPNGTYSGGVSRNTNVSNVLKILEYSDVHYRIEGKKIIFTK